MSVRVEAANKKKSCSLMIKGQIRAQRGKTSTLSSEFGLRIVIVAAISRLPRQQRFNQMTISTCSIFLRVLSQHQRPTVWTFPPFSTFCFSINILEAINLNMEKNKMRRLEICEPHNFHSRYTLYISFRREKKRLKMKISLFCRMLAHSPELRSNRRPFRVT